MTLPLPLLQELCADSRTVPVLGGGMHLHLGPQETLNDSVSLQRADLRQRPAQVTPLSFDLDGVTGSALPSRFLDRVPAEAVDRMVYIPPSGRFDGATLTSLADQLGIAVQVPSARFSGSLADFPHHLLAVDAANLPTTVEESDQVRGLPSSARGASAFADASSQVVALLMDVLYFNGRIAHGPTSVSLGWPGGLVSAVFGPSLDRFGRPLDSADFPSMSFMLVRGYADLIGLAEGMPANGQATIQVDDALVLAHKDQVGNLSFVDPSLSGAAVFPPRPRSLGFAQLSGTMSLAARLDSLNDVRHAQPVTWDLNWPRGVHAEGDLVVIGSLAGEPASLVGPLRGIAAAGQPVVLIPTARSGASPDERAAPLVNTVLNQYGWRNKVPLVVTRGDPGTSLVSVTALYGAPLVHRVELTQSAPSDGLTVNLGPRWAWGVHGGQQSTELPALLESLASSVRRPAYGRPPESVTSYLSTPLKARTFDFTAMTVSTLTPLVTRMTQRDPALGAHSAALHLAGMGRADTVNAYLNADGHGSEVLLEPLSSAPGDTAQDRADNVSAMLPHLTALTVGELDDPASQSILTAIAGMLDGTFSFDQMRDKIWEQKDLVPTGDGRVRLVRQVTRIGEALPESHAAGFQKVGEIILTCP